MMTLTEHKENFDEEIGSIEKNDSFVCEKRTNEINSDEFKQHI